VTSRRLTATTRQLLALPEIEAEETVAGNDGPAIAKEWPCEVLGCYNYGKTCWVKGEKTCSNCTNHFKCDTSMMTKWSRLNCRNSGSIKEPSNTIVIALVEQRLRDKQSRKNELLGVVAILLPAPAPTPTSVDSTSGLMSMMTTILMASMIDRIPPQH
jgi:hypothetical protein